MRYYGYLGEILWKTTSFVAAFNLGWIYATPAHLPPWWILATPLVLGLLAYACKRKDESGKGAKE